MEPIDNEIALRQSWAAAFASTFWAFLLIALDFRLGLNQFSIDILPDFVGYALLASAGNRLVTLHPGARTVRALPAILVFLSLGDCVQYVVKEGNVPYPVLPFFPISILVGLLDLIVVWKLCGIVADLARSTGESRTEGAALVRRVLYIGLSILSVGAVAATFAAPQAIFFSVGALLLLALIIICLMMGLMKQAQRICLESPVLPQPQVEGGGWLGFSFIAGVICLGVLLQVGVIWYYLQWKEARDAVARINNSGPFDQVSNVFFADIAADRLEAAYQSTSTGFKERMSQQQFEDLIRRYPAVKRGPGTTTRGAGSSFGRELTEYFIVGDAQGKYIRVSTVVRRDKDSIFQLEPPPLKVDELKVEDVPDPDVPFHRRPPRFGH